MPEDSSELIALRLLEQSTTPIGAARLARAWKEAGLPGAEATAGRFLRQLDVMKYTQLCGLKRGRTLTNAGITRLSQLDDNQRLNDHQAQLWRAINATELSDLLDLLHLRRMVEIEAARLAAIRATDEEIATLADVAVDCGHDHRSGDITASSMDFHRLIAKASHNRIVGAVALMLLDPKNDPLERALEFVSAESGATLDQLNDHVELIRAFQQRRADDAARIMTIHMDKLIAAVEQYRSQERPSPNGVAIPDRR